MSKPHAVFSDKPDYKWLDVNPYVSIGEALKGIKPIPQVVDGLLARNGVSIIFGMPNCGKSFISLSLAFCASTGEDWFGYKVHPTRTLICVGEGRQGTLMRLSALQKEFDKEVSNDRLFINHEEFNLQMLDKWTHVGAGPDGGAIRKEMTASDEFVRHVLEIEQKHCGGKPLGLIILDPLQSILGGIADGKSENSVEVIAELFNSLKKITDRPAKTAVVIVHHSGWDQTRLRGSSAILGMAQSVFKVSKQHDEIVLEQVKAKDSGLISNKYFRLKTVKLGTWKPDMETIRDYEAMDLPVPPEQELISAVIEESQDLLSATVAFDKDKNPISAEDCLREILRSSNFDIISKQQKVKVEYDAVGRETRIPYPNDFEFKAFASNIDASTEQAHCALSALSERLLIMKEGRKAYKLTDLSINLLRERDGLNDDIEIDIKD